MFPRWLSWMFLFAMGYVIFSASQGGKPVVQVAAPSTVPAITEETYPALAKATDIERWKRKLNPDYASVTNCSLDGLSASSGLAVKVFIEAAGVGARAACGETIRVTLTVWNEKGSQAYTGDVDLALGSRALAAGLDFGLLGIAIGEVRSIILPPYALIHTKTSTAPDAAKKALSGPHVAVVRVKRLN
mgnify:CR=1 FL=1